MCEEGRRRVGSGERRKQPDLRQADLRAGRLRRAELSGTQLAGALFRNPDAPLDLRGIILDHSDLRGVAVAAGGG
jgi:uncharacterized protein YjbI with pentapeptide repeats